MPHEAKKKPVRLTMSNLLVQPMHQVWVSFRCAGDRMQDAGPVAIIAVYAVAPCFFFVSRSGANGQRPMLGLGTHRGHAMPSLACLLIANVANSHTEQCSWPRG